MQLAKSSSFSKLSFLNSLAIVYDTASSTTEVDTNIDSGGAGVERILHKLDHYSTQGSYSCGRLDLRNDVFRERLNRGRPLGHDCQSSMRDL